jgi:glycosyltransferase involved in cell wall biosynthesis
MEISLVMGSYNPKLEWLDKALKSCIGLFDEIILVDDGSKIPIKHNIPTKIVRQNNKGFAETRNRGILEARGDVIASLDDDDYFIPENVLKLKEFIKLNDSDIWHFQIDMFGDRTGLWGENISDNIFDYDQIPSGSWFKKSVWQDVGGYGKCRAEDWEFWCKAKTLNKKFTYFDLPIYFHRMRGDSLSAKFTPEMNNDFREQIKTSCELLTKPI